MKILVTGAKGFIGRNLIAELKNRSYTDILEYDKDSDISLLDNYCKEADFIYHLAGVNRPKEETEYMEGNFGFTKTLLQTLKKYNNRCPIMMSSSIQASQDNLYGCSKKAGEDELFEYSKETGVNAYVYRLPNVFGKWCRPNYNSVIATFCNNISNHLPITVNDPGKVLNLVYIDDVIKDLIMLLDGNVNLKEKFYEVSTVYTKTLEEIVQLLYSFTESRENGLLPDVGDMFTKKLYSTYLSYLPENSFGYALSMNVDHRGSFTEFVKTQDRGQISVNVSKPGIVKGNHWHHTKIEKFLVVSGTGVIRLRKINETKIIEYFVSDKKLEVIDIPIGYTHNIENIGNDDLVTIIWANEIFNPDNPDTYYMKV